MKQQIENMILGYAILYKSTDSPKRRDEICASVGEYLHKVVDDREYNEHIQVFLRKIHTPDPPVNPMPEDRREQNE